MIKELRKLEEQGLITLRPHNTLPLLIANYTPDVQYSRLWNDHPLLTQCRGLIVSESGEVIGRSMEKFFNYEEHLQFDDLPDIPLDEPHKVYNKLDGSLGIVFFYDGKWRISTRGSFHSDQAEYAEKNLLPKYDLSKLSRDYTYLVEIIYKQNRIVVDYGDKEELILVATIRTEDGAEPLSLERYRNDKPYNVFPIVKEFKLTMDYLIENSDKFDDGNTEGFVIHFYSGLRVKMKLEQYVKLHKVLTGLTKRRIWELLRDGEDIDEIYKIAPDEVYDWIEETVNELQTQYKELELASKLVFASAYCKLAKEIDLLPKHMPDKKEVEEYEAKKRKEFAKIVTSNEKIKKEGLVPFMFRMYDGKKIEDLIWKLIYPDHEIINTE